MILRIRTIKFILLCLVASIVTCASPVAASEQADKIKAVFLFKFFDYVTWPNKNLKSKTLCTLGDIPFKSHLNYIASTDNYKSVNLRYLTNVKESENCHILYTQANSTRTNTALAGYNDLLVVGTTKDMLKSAASISMIEESGRIKIYINLKEAQKKGIRISSRLLDIAEVIR